MKTVVIAHRPGSKLAGASIGQFEEEFNRQNARVKKVDIRNINGRLQGDIILLYNSSYRIHEKRLAKAGIPVFNVPKVHGKDNQYQIFKNNDVDIPDYMVVNNRHEIQNAIDLLGLPVVTKPIIGTGGRGVTLHKNYDSFNRTFKGSSLIAQSYVKEAARGDIRALVIDGEVVCSLWRTPQGNKLASNFHAGGTPSAYTIKTEEAELAVRAAECIGLSVSGVDVVPTDQGPLIFEANSVPDLMYMKEVAGVDAIPAYVSAVLKSA